MAAQSEKPAARLVVRSLSKQFGSRVALHDISFEVGAGELVAVIGPNGAGKTTLLSILAGVLDPSTGGVGPASGGVGPASGEVGWVPQQPALYSKLSVAENLRLFARLEGLSDPDAAVTRMLEQTGLGERAQDEVARLSGGNQQRVNIAIGLLADPAVLLLDEPSSALDPLQRERLWEFVCELVRRGTTVVFSTHNVLEAERYGDRVLVLVDGELLFTGTPSELERAVERDGQAPLASGPRDFESAFVHFLRLRGHGS